MKLYNLKQSVFRIQRLFCAHFPLLKNRMNDKQAQAILESYRPCAVKLIAPPMDEPQPGLDLSILIPAYNVAPYIRECLHSVFDQYTSYNYEVIVVDDGSTDGTGSILDELSEEYGFKVIHQINKGLAGTRNRLLDEAHGEYVMFVDSDDLLVPNAVEALMSKTDDGCIDIVQGSHRNIDESGISLGNIIQTTTGTCSSYGDRMRLLSGVAWGKIIRRKLFSNVRFIENLVFEDTLFHFVIYELCNTATIVPDEVYRYRINPNGITHTTKGYQGIDTIYQVDALLLLRDRIGLPMNGDLYRMLLFQCGPMLFNRMRHYDKELLRAAFIHSANRICNLKVNSNRDPTANQKYIELAFQSRNFLLWKACCRIPLEL